MSNLYSYRVLEYLRNFMEIARKVKDIVKRIDPSARVYVFGSVVTQRFTGASDIDILVITENIDKKYEIVVEVYRDIEAPVELHVATPTQFDKWYRRFIDSRELIEV